MTKTHIGSTIIAIPSTELLTTQVVAGSRSTHSGVQAGIHDPHLNPQKNYRTPLGKMKNGQLLSSNLHTKSIATNMPQLQILESKRNLGAMICWCGLSSRMDSPTVERSFTLTFCLQSRPKSSNIIFDFIDMLLGKSWEPWMVMVKANSNIRSRL